MVDAGARAFQIAERADLGFGESCFCFQFTEACEVRFEFSLQLQRVSILGNNKFLLISNLPAEVRDFF